MNADTLIAVRQLLEENRRVFLAGMALQGMLASEIEAEGTYSRVGDVNIYTLAVTHADRLLEALDA